MSLMRAVLLGKSRVGMSIALEDFGMRRSIGKNWLWLAGGAAIATILAILPMPASAAESVTICVSKSGLIKGINFNDSSACKPTATPVTWNLCQPVSSSGSEGQVPMRV